MIRLRRFPIAMFAFLAFALSGALAQQPGADAPKDEYVRVHYTKYAYRIPMRDGKRLFTNVFVPKNATEGP